MDDLKIDWTDFRSKGLLWIINRCVFHPRGFALGVDIDNPGTFYLYGNGSEPWQYASEVGEKDLFTIFCSLLEEAKEKSV